MTMIENSDRGITINKALAWSMVCGLVGAGVYVGITIATLTTSLDGISNRVLEQQQNRTALESRVRVLENANASSEVQFRNLAAAIDDVRIAQRETNALLRQITRGDAP